MGSICEALGVMTLSGATAGEKRWGFEASVTGSRIWSNFMSDSVGPGAAKTKVSCSRGCRNQSCADPRIQGMLALNLAPKGTRGAPGSPRGPLGAAFRGVQQISDFRVRDPTLWHSQFRDSGPSQQPPKSRPLDTKYSNWGHLGAEVL